MPLAPAEFLDFQFGDRITALGMVGLISTAIIMRQAYAKWWRTEPKRRGRP